MTKSLRLTNDILNTHITEHHRIWDNIDRWTIFYFYF
jgi:hypothetical protein